MVSKPSTNGHVHAICASSKGKLMVTFRAYYWDSVSLATVGQQSGTATIGLRRTTQIHIGLILAQIDIAC